MIEAVGEILTAPQQKSPRIPRWLPDGTEAKTLGQVATLLRTDVTGAALYVLEAKRAGEQMDFGLIREVVDLMTRRLPPPRRGIKPPPASFKKGVAVMIPVPLSSSHFLHMDGGALPDDLHITIAYYGKMDDEDFDFDKESMLDNMRDVASQFKPFDVTLNGITRFSGEAPVGDPLVVSCDSPILDEIRVSTIDLVGTPKMDHGFHPHITLGFVDVDEPTPGPDRLAPIVIHVDALVLGWEDMYYRVSLGDGTELSEMKDVYHGEGPGGIPITRTAGVPKLHARMGAIRNRLDDRKKRKHKIRKPRLKESAEVLEFKDERDFLDEQKAVRRVRTPAGARRFGQPIGSIIVRDSRSPLSGLMLGDSDYDGWDKVKGSNGKTYFVGKDEDDGKWYATEGEGWDKIVVTADTEDAAFEGLSRHVTNRSAKPAPAKKTPTRKEPARGGIPQGVRKVRTEADYADEYDKYRDNNGKSIYVTKKPDKNGDYITYDKDDNEISRSGSQNAAVAIAALRMGNRRHEKVPNKPQEVPVKPVAGLTADVNDARMKIRNAASMHGGQYGEQLSTVYEKLNNAYATDDPDARTKWLEGAVQELIDAKTRAPKKDMVAMQRWIDLFSNEVNSQKKPEATKPKPAPKVKPAASTGKGVHKTSPLAANEALHVWETQRDEGRDPGFTVDGNTVTVTDPELALSELSYQLDIHADNADPLTNPDPKDRARAKRRFDAMRKLMDDIRKDGGPGKA